MKNSLFSVLVFLAVILLGCSANKLETLETSGYSMVEESVNYAIVVLKKSEIEVEGNTIRNGMPYQELVNKFNAEYGDAAPKIRASFIAIQEAENNYTPVITIRRFDGFPQAETYATQLQKFLQKNVEGITSTYAISQLNYRNLLRRRDIREYEQFYKLTAAVD
ncbi:hypothetical protein [Flavilitoribacter nigricans]|uniref:Uncharacterized protein n=1 Tax=Flavilitoribacter nigricans (strain ATCC 23147 / DSM 23189 / NBRC 102662 / NCIMB 1420 / SS-2) TaxID=1122177 RepID=A0A2D0N4S4_FLAN2|nr:hypothetical protein [Flavilitoribacter nigricans]PHN03521.1 hypothetical protein CRP01_26335 [Flavilitoribacter nigricans DSM 23189 = NBRC 102662]